MKEVMEMLKLLLAYIEQFGADFPISKVKDRNEYEICRMVQECLETNKAYGVTETAAAETGK